MEGTYLGQTGGLGVVEIIHSVPDRLEDPRDHNGRFDQRHSSNEQY